MRWRILGIVRLSSILPDQNSSFHEVSRKFFQKNAIFCFTAFNSLKFLFYIADEKGNSVW